MIDTNGVCVIVQARLNSTRLPRKALLNLDDKNLLEHVLNSLQKVSAQCFVLACDENSYNEFLPIAKKYNFLLVGGSETNVLSRFILALQKANEYCHENNLPQINCIVRATADNPFLFIEAINDSIIRYNALNAPDYFTLTGLPKGSGVELFNPQALIKADTESVTPYEMEHVGPAIYFHKDLFNVVYETAEKKYYYPDLITTVDTPEDFLRTQYALKFLHEKKIKLPANAQDIILATKYASDTIIFIPSVQEGNGSGHLRRVIELAMQLEKKFRTQIFIRNDALPLFAKKLLLTVPEQMIIHALPKKAKLIVLDNFKTSANEVEVLKIIAPVLALDEGGEARNNANYLLDTIPQLQSDNQIPAANISDISFIPLPKNRKAKTAQKKIIIQNKKVLVCCGGEDKKNMALPVGIELSKLNFDITVISPETSFSKIMEVQGKIKLLHSIPNLREELYRYDLVFTIFGFTAFEALAAGCFVVLLSPTEYHYQLGIQNGFTCFPIGIPNIENIKNILSSGIKVPQFINDRTEQKNLSKQISTLYHSQYFHCPLCHDENYSYNEHSIIYRLPDRTISQCKKTDLYFVSFIVSDKKQYGKDYFFDEYKKQYGKTYLEDFANIMEQGIRRLKEIDACYAEYLESGESFFNKQKNILDIGCAYGAFLKACTKSDWFAVGTDISSDAVQYVVNELKLPAFCAAFPALPKSFSYKRKSQLHENNFEEVNFKLTAHSFQAITMWYVIEHFQDLNAVLKQVHELLVDGGIFAFSTPTLSGISGKQNEKEFFAQSPSDHYSIFDFTSVEKVLDEYGFKLVKIVSTGHHPERFKHFTKCKKGSLPYKIIHAISKRKKLGDSMEVYAVKRIII